MSPQGAFTRGVTAGRQAGEGGGIFTQILGAVSRVEKRRREENALRAKEDRELKDTFKVLSEQERLQRETQARGIEARGIEARELAGVRGEEARETEEARARLRPKEVGLRGLLGAMQRPAVGPRGRPIGFGREEELFEIPERAVITPASGRVATQADVLGRFGLRPTLTGGKIGVTGVTRAEEEAFKPTQLSQQEAQDFQASVQKGMSYLQSNTINPATGEPFTALEIYRHLAADYPFQANKLKTIFLSGREPETTESLENILFAE